jgi:hypothetical protein
MKNEQASNCEEEPGFTGTLTWRDVYESARCRDYAASASASGKTKSTFSSSQPLEEAAENFAIRN